MLSFLDKRGINRSNDFIHLTSKPLLDDRSNSYSVNNGKLKLFEVIIDVPSILKSLENMTRSSTI